MNMIKGMAPDKLVHFWREQKSLSDLVIWNGYNDWKNRNFLEHSPQFVKQKVFSEYGVADAFWIETGTYLGDTTNYLRKRYPHVYSIEPSDDLYHKACQRFKGKNVTLYNDVSEKILPQLLPTLSGSVNFWLDGHYSAGITFKGEKDCPVEDELKAIEDNFDNFSRLSILIDDVRCFLQDKEYPSIDYLVDWSRSMGLRWTIVHDIFIMQSR